VSLHDAARAAREKADVSLGPRDHQIALGRSQKPSGGGAERGHAETAWGCAAARPGDRANR